MSYKSKRNPLRGREAPVAKYDILAAIGVAAFGKSCLAKDLAHRLTVLIVARYNWAADELSVGRQQLAELWNVDERRVKRLVAELKSQGILAVKRAGVRGRVTTYRLGLEAIIEITRPYWGRLGRDIKARLDENFPESGGIDQDADVTAHGSRPDTTVQPILQGEGVHDGGPEADRADNGPFIRAMREVFRGEAFARWFGGARIEQGGSRVVLHVRSKFAADYIEANYGDQLDRLAERLHPQVRRIEVSSS